MDTFRTPAELARDLERMTPAELELEVQRHNHLYWVDHTTLIADELFDRLVERLRALAPASPVLDAIGPAGALGELGADDKVVHERPMLSLDKAYDEETVAKWFDRFEGDAVGSPKVDGIACSLRYDERGRLALGATRGDGARGEQITENVKRIQNLPTQVAAANLEVRGEVYMPLSVFETYRGKYANPRNLAAGALKQKDPEQTATYRLRFFAYDILGEDLATEADKFARLAALGFEPVPTTLLTRDALRSFYTSMAAGRAALDYETDGVVFRANVVAEQGRMGATAHHPRFAIAYKYQGESGTSTLVDVHWSVSRTGAINPVAIVEPVTLSGASVSRASLHNLAFLEGLGLRLGAEVLMTRRGGVIPHVEKVVTPGTTPFDTPTHCPSCGAAPTERRGDFLYCPDQGGCKAAQLSLLKHFVDAIDCKGFGPKLIEKLFEDESVREPADFYALTANVLLPLERMGETLAGKLVEHVRERTTLPVDKLLQALAIPDLGKVASRVVAVHFGTMDAIRAASIDDFAAIYGLGETTGRNIFEGLRERAAVIDRLLEYVELVSVEAAPEPSGDGVLAGKRVLFTGTLASMKRKDAQQMVVEAGGVAPDGVVKELDYLVLGDADLERFNQGWRSSKLKKVDKFNGDGGQIQVIGETDFLALFTP